MRTGEPTTGTISGRGGATGVDSQPLYSTFDPGLGEVSVDIARAVAEAVGDVPAGIEPLASVIDPDALQTLVGGDRSPESGWTEVTFEYLGYEVTVCSDGVLTLDPRTD